MLDRRFLPFVSAARVAAGVLGAALALAAPASASAQSVGTQRIGGGEIQLKLPAAQLNALVPGALSGGGGASTMMLGTGLAGGLAQRCPPPPAARIERIHRESIGIYNRIGFPATVEIVAGASAAKQQAQIDAGQVTTLPLMEEGTLSVSTTVAQLGTVTTPEPVRIRPGRLYIIVGDGNTPTVKEF